jgi:hypothetical protein
MAGSDMAGNDSSEILEQPTSTPLTGAASNSKQAVDYNDQLKQDFQRMFDLLTLNQVQKEFLKARWLDQVLWMEKKAMRCRDRHIKLRMVTIIGGVFIPALITFGTMVQNNWQKPLQVAAVLGSAGVAACSAVEGFFSYGRQWYSYRQSVESLKSNGWQFFQLTGPYTGQTHATAFNSFSIQVEELIQRDVELYVTQLNQQQKQQQEQEQEMLQKLRDLDIQAIAANQPKPT